MLKRNHSFIVLMLLASLAIFSLTGCNKQQPSEPQMNIIKSSDVNNTYDYSDIIPTLTSSNTAKFDISDVSEYAGFPSVFVNDGVPYFTSEEIASGMKSYINLSDLDEFGRCGPAIASVSTDTMPTEERGNIGSVKPTGWHTVKYDGIDGNYLYNRCHLLMYALTGLNAEPKNLITGTRYLNIEGNLPYEEKVVEYIRNTGNHVLYRVTPIFEGDNLLCSGELMEAYSIEDNGAFQFCVYCYNVQPGVTIDYATGDSSGPEFTGNSGKSTSGEIPIIEDTAASESTTYILNTSSLKIHKPDCDSVAKINDKNKKEYTGNKEELLKQGYTTCKSCNP